MPEGEHHLSQHAGAVDHRGVDHLAFAGPLPLVERRQDPDEQEHRPAAEVADQVQRRNRTLAGAADGVQHTVERDVVDVVAGLLASRAGLAPARHPGVDQPVVDCGAVLRAEAQTLGDAGTETLDEDVRLGDQPHYQLAVLIAFEVRGDRSAVAHQEIATGRRVGHLARPLDPHDVRTEVAEDHRRVGAGADPGQFDHAQTVQRSRHCPTALRAVKIPHGTRPRRGPDRPLYRVDLCRLTPASPT